MTSRRSRLVRALCAVVVALSFAASVPPAAAAAKPTKQQQQDKQARRDQISQQISTLRDQVEEASAEEDDLLGRLDDVQNRRRSLDGKVASLDRQIAGVQADLDAAEARLEQLSAELVQSQAKVRAAEGEVRTARAELRDRAVAAYIGQPGASAADAMLRSKTFRDVAATVGYLEAVVRAQKDALDRFTARRDEVDALRKSLEATKDQARAERDVVITHQGQLEAARAEQDGVRQEVLAQEQEQAALLDEVRSRKAEFEGQIAALRAESNSISLFLRGLQSGQVVQPSGRGVLAVPVPGARITSTFGPRVHPILGTVRMHDGIDFGVPAGTPIQAAADGVVVYAGPRGGYGNATVIDHGNALATLYAHQSVINVNVGDHVTRGQVIGLVGSTGFSTGPHLHFEVRENGVPVDPLRYL